MADPLNDIEYFQRQIASSMAVPAKAMSMAEGLAPAMASMKLATDNAARRVGRLRSVIHDEIMVESLHDLRELLNPRSAVDRLADLVRDDA